MIHFRKVFSILACASIIPLSIALAQDGDGDMISDDLEINGYVCDVGQGLEAWDGDESRRYFKTDPLRWSTDGDPYSDFMESCGVNMPTEVSLPFAHPLVAARPIISVFLDDYTVTPNAEISDTESMLESTSYTNSTSNKIKTNAKLETDSKATWGIGGPKASVRVKTSLSRTETKTTSSSSTIAQELNWSHTTTSNPSKAANLTLNYYLVNNGSATARDVIPTFNILINGRTIATVVPAESTDLLPPGERYPAESAGALQTADINVTLSELAAIQSGTPLELSVAQVSANVARWDATNQIFVTDQDWADFESQINPATIRLHANLGDGVEYDFQVFAGTEFFNPMSTFADIVKTVFDVDESGGSFLIEGRPYPDAWYINSDSQEFLDAWTAAGEPSSLLDLDMIQNTSLFMLSPGPNPGPIVNFAAFDAEFETVRVSATPTGGFPIVDAFATVFANGSYHQIPLEPSDDEPILSTIVTLPGIADASVTVIDARGDSTTVTVSITGTGDCSFYADQHGPLNPGGVHPVWVDNDPAHLAQLYCRYYDEGGIQLPQPIQSFWLPQDFNISGVAPNDVAFSDEMTGYVADGTFPDGRLLRTRDGGETWAALTVQNQSPCDCLLTGISTNGPDTVAVVGLHPNGDSRIGRSIDGGETWDTIFFLFEPDELLDITHASPNALIAVGTGPNSILRSSDSGLNWIPSTTIPVSPSIQLRSVDFFDEQTGLIVGLEGTILKTTDAGENWSQITSGTTASLLDVSIIDESAAIAVGANGLIIRTTNSGETWSPIVSPVTVDLHGVDFSGLTGRAVGLAGTILSSKDGGLTWSLDPTGQFVQISKIAVLGDSLAIAVGSVGIVKTNTGGGDPTVGVAIENSPDHVLEKPANLLLNYPNPFGTETTISYSLRNSSAISVRLFDMMGREVRLLVEGFVGAGNHEVTLTGESLASGIYFVQLDTGDYLETMPVMVVH